MGEFEISSDEGYNYRVQRSACLCLFVLPGLIYYIWVWFLSCHVDFTLVEDIVPCIRIQGFIHEFLIWSTIVWNDLICHMCSHYITPTSDKNTFYNYLFIYLFTELGMLTLSLASYHVTTRPFLCISCMFVHILF